MIHSIFIPSDSPSKIYIFAYIKHFSATKIDYSSKASLGTQKDSIFVKQWYCSDFSFDYIETIPFNLMTMWKGINDIRISKTEEQRFAIWLIFVILTVGLPIISTFNCFILLVCSITGTAQRRLYYFTEVNMIRKSYVVLYFFKELSAIYTDPDTCFQIWYYTKFPNFQIFVERSIFVVQKHLIIWKKTSIFDERYNEIKIKWFA